MARTEQKSRLQTNLVRVRASKKLWSKDE